MGTVRVPRDIKKVKPKFLGPLNKRQTYTMAIGIGLGVAGYYASKPYIGASNAIFVLMAIMLPITLCGLFEKDNRYVEDMVRDYVNVKFLRRKICTVIFTRKFMIRRCLELTVMEKVRQSLGKKTTGLKSSGNKLLNMTKNQIKEDKEERKKNAGNGEPDDKQLDGVIKFMENGKFK